VFYSEYHSLSGGVGSNGAIGEAGIRFGGEVSQLIVGYLPANELVVFGVGLSNLLGWKVAEFGKTATFSVLAPSVAFKLATNFEDIYLTPEATALGLAYVRCTGFPLSLKVRAPSFAVWLPIESNGQEFPDDAVPIVSVGAGFEIGVVFF
jgi:hypothetical protein